MMESTSPMAGSINYAKAYCTAASNALSQYYAHSCSQSLHMYTMYLKFCCFLSVINYDNSNTVSQCNCI